MTITVHTSGRTVIFFMKIFKILLVIDIIVMLLLVAFLIWGNTIFNYLGWDTSWQEIMNRSADDTIQAARFLYDTTCEGFSVMKQAGLRLVGLVGLGFESVGGFMITWSNGL